MGYPNVNKLNRELECLLDKYNAIHCGSLTIGMTLGCLSVFVVSTYI